MQSKWEFFTPLNTEVLTRMITQLRIPRPVARVLYNRGLEEREEVFRFVHPDTKNLHSPFLMKSMDLAVERLITALREKENILIHGDYDVDGITSVALLYLFLKDLGGRAVFYIPERTLEGYGLSKGGVEEARKMNCSLIISVDCGITSVEEVQLANSYGIDVIVTDHHEPGEALPDAYAIVDPKQSDCEYPFKELAGCGVAYKLAQGIQEQLELEPDFCEKYLDLVAIGTAADIVPLVDENRVFVRIGLKKLNENGLEGIITLLETANLPPGQIDVGHIVFGLAPRINAVGRLGHALPAVELLITRNQYRAREIAQSLEGENRRRKEIDSKTLQEAMVKIQKEYDPERDSVIVLAEEGWHPGVIGIVASRIIERYYRPTVMITIENGIGKGSARSIANFDLHSAIKSCSDLLIQFGGHKYAAGLSIEADKIPEFRRRFNEVASSILTPNDYIPKITIDDELAFNEITSGLVDMLEKLAPFGPHNARPLFTSSQLSLVGMPRIVGKDHLKFRVCQDGICFDAIAYNRGGDLAALKQSKVVDIVYNLEVNRFNNQATLQLKIKDLHI